jgi:hypothetical protein
MKPDKQQVFSINDNEQFNVAALHIFRHQAKKCTVYADFIAGLGIDSESVSTINQIPFLPIQFFKSHRILSTADDVQVTFTSSGTTFTAILLTIRY